MHLESCEQKELTNATAYYLAKDIHPIHSVKLSAFRTTVNKLRVPLTKFLMTPKEDKSEI